MMKNTMPYLIVIAATFLLSGAVVVGILVFRPDLLKGSTVPPPASLDTAATEQGPVYAREIAGPTFEELNAATAARKDSLTVMRDSVKVMFASLEQERRKNQEVGSRPEGMPGEGTQRKARETQRQGIPRQPLLQTDSAQTAGMHLAAPDSITLKLRKSRAKMLEAMPAESAAKILAKMSDDESRALLQYVKARQAAKIISAIEPERASRLLR